MAKIVCVTSCITGIAHTYMAAEALEQAGKKMGHDIKVETQGSAGSNPFKQSEIDSADAVIFAVDLEVKDRDRFNGKPYVEVPVAKAMHGAQALVTQLLESIENGTAKKVGEGSSAKAEKEKKADKPASEKKGGFLGGLFGKK
jgi:PTS system fructose-specific IIC component